MYYVLLTNRLTGDYHVPASTVNGINKAKHMRVETLLKEPYRSAILVRKWEIIKINEDGTKETVTIGQLEREYPELVEQHLAWLPYMPTPRVSGDWT